MRLLVSGSTRTVKRLAGQFPDLLGHLLVPRNGNRVASLLQTGLPWAADNGAYSGFEPDRFRVFLSRIKDQPRCLWVVCPDAIRDARATLALFAQWREETARAGQPLAFVGQDGAEALDLPWDDFACYFIAGSDDWRFSRAGHDLAREARQRGKALHMGRVNSLVRLELAHDWGCGSADGSSASKWGDRYVHGYLRWLAHLRSQQTLFAHATGKEGAA